MPGSRRRGCEGNYRHRAPRPASAAGHRSPTYRLPRWPSSRPDSHPGHPVPRRPQAGGLLYRPLPGACAGLPTGPGHPGAAGGSPAHAPTAAGIATLVGPTLRGVDPSGERVQRLLPLAPLSNERDGSCLEPSSDNRDDEGWRLATNEKPGRTPRRGWTYRTTARAEHAQRHRLEDGHRGQEEGENIPWLERERGRGVQSERNIPACFDPRKNRCHGLIG